MPDNTFPTYDKSPIPSQTPGGMASERDPNLGILEGPSGELNYASAGESGHVEIELPSLPGSPTATERLHARDFGQHVIGRIESSMNRQGYMQSGPQQGPAAVLRHYAAVSRGAGLMDNGAQRRLEEIAAEFTKKPEQATYFREVVKPYLGGLAPHRRQS